MLSARQAGEDAQGLPLLGPQGGGLGRGRPRVEGGQDVFLTQQLQHHRHRYHDQSQSHLGTSLLEHVDPELVCSLAGLRRDGDMSDDNVHTFLTQYFPFRLHHGVLLGIVAQDLARGTTGQYLQSSDVTGRHRP